MKTQRGGRTRAPSIREGEGTMTNWRNRAGFTLIELVAGITVLALTFLPAIQR
jgi:prepilin-type N-terminal cleavage/methylation domain-containing protein